MSAKQHDKNGPDNILPELAISGCWIEPHSNITYLERSEFKVELQNNSRKEIEIVKMGCQFQTEDGVHPKVFSLEPMVSIKPHNLEFFRVPFIVDLSLRQGTNYAILEIVYRYKGEIDLISVSFSYPETRYLMINSKHSPEKHFFISHKDPQQEVLATRVDHNLIKIGYMGYVAERDKKPGVDLWREKILPKIDSCVALVVLWTKDAADNPNQILREVRRAKSKKKKIVVLAENGVSIHEIFKGTKEYISADGKIGESDLIQLVEHIEETYRTGGYRS
ncbi:MAG: TIR domain-containing protein [Candidatus Nitrosotenuis sp.]|nr:MAG: TIR domain-containing protein [Candidatus Nitrosotenuis sp.]